MRIKPAIFSLITISVVGYGVYYLIDSSENEYSFDDYKPELKEITSKNNSDISIDSARQKESNNKIIGDRSPAADIKRVIKPEMITSRPHLQRQKAMHLLDPKIASSIIVSKDIGFDFDGEEYALVDNVYAIREPDFDGSGEVIGQRFNYYLVRTDNPPIAVTSVVQNTKNGKLVIFTGVLKVKFFNFDDLTDLDLKVTYQVQEEYPYMHRALLQFNSYDDTMVAFEHLRNHTLIEMVEIELLKYERVNK